MHDPAVWVTSAAHDTQHCDPLPVALFEPGCWWRARALQILEDRGRRYRIACSSPHKEAVAAAVITGLAVAVVELPWVHEGARFLLAADGFPGFTRTPIMLRRPPRPAPRASEARRVEK